MKVFKIFNSDGDRIDQYIVLKCPYCKHIFRFKDTLIYGKEIKNKKCINCNKIFKFSENQLDEDPILKMWATHDNKFLMEKPNGKKLHIKRKIIHAPKIKLALNYKK